MTETNLQIGPFEVMRTLTAAPGAILAEGRDAEGRRRLLQLIPLADAVPAEVRTRAESAAALATAEVDVPMHGHGACDGPNGERILYWVLPWIEDSAPVVEEDVSAHHRWLEKVARRLAEWLAARHRKGRTHALLSAPLTRIDEQGLVKVIGVPITLDPAWTAGRLQPPPWAPEELESRRATSAGDLWRLGEVIRTLSGRSGLPKALLGVVDRLCADQPRLRPRSADEVVRLLIDGRRERLRSVLSSIGPVPRPTHPPAPPVETIGPVATEPHAIAPDDSTATPPFVPFDAARVAQAVAEADARSHAAEAGGPRDADAAGDEDTAPFEFGPLPDSASASRAATAWAKPAALIDSSSVPPPANGVETNGHASTGFERLSGGTMVGRMPTLDDPGASKLDDPGASKLDDPGASKLDDPGASKNDSAPARSHRARIRGAPPKGPSTEPDLKPIEAPGRSAFGADSGGEDDRDASPASGATAPGPGGAPPGAADGRPAAVSGARDADGTSGSKDGDEAPPLLSPVDVRPNGTPPPSADPVASDAAEGPGAPSPSSDSRIEPVAPAEEALLLVAGAPKDADASQIAEANTAAESVNIPAAEAVDDDGGTLSGRSMFRGGPAPDGPNIGPEIPAELAADDLPELSPADIETVEPSPSEPAPQVVVPAASSVGRAKGGSPSGPSLSSAVVVGPDMSRAFGGEAELPAESGEETVDRRPKDSIEFKTPVQAVPTRVTTLRSGAGDKPNSTPTGSGAALSAIPRISGTDRKAIPSMKRSSRGRAKKIALPDQVLIGTGLRRWLVIGGAALLMVIVGFVWGGGEAEPPQAVAPPPPVLVRADRMLTLMSEPPGAEVIAEADGQLLGRTPLYMMLPQGRPMAVFVDAPDRLPMRVVLPSHGELRAVLPIAPKASCSVTVVGSADVVLQAHRGTQTVPGQVSIPGAAIFRREGAGRRIGARLIECPSDAQPATAEVSLAPARRREIGVLTPPDASVRIGGRNFEPGTGPVFTERAFEEVRVEDAEGRRFVRWVGLADRTEVRLPAPVDAVEVSVPAIPAVVVSPTRDVSATAQATVDSAEASTSESRTRVRRPRRSAVRAYRRARRALASGRNKAARTGFRRCLKYDSDYAECHRGLATAYRRLKQGDRAETHYRRYLELRPNASDADRIRRILDESPRL